MNMFEPLRKKPVCGNTTSDNDVTVWPNKLDEEHLSQESMKRSGSLSKERVRFCHTALAVLS